jgi:hypothetical protein
MMRSPGGRIGRSDIGAEYVAECIIAGADGVRQFVPGTLEGVPQFEARPGAHRAGLVCSQGGAEWRQYRGREPGYPGPPAQIRTGSFPAYGSYLGCLTAKRSRGHG